MAKRIFRGRPSLREQQIIHPNREWLVGILLAVVSFLAISGWSVDAYLKYQNTAVTGEVVPDEEVIVYRESLVQAALAAFTEREQNFSDLLENKIVVAEAPTTTDNQLETETPENLTPEDIIATSTATSSPSETENVSEESEENESPAVPSSESDTDLQPAL